MKKLIFLLFLFTFASSASATVYKWVEEGGTVNFTDDFSSVPLAYHDSVQEINVPKMQRPTLSQVSSAQSAKQAPPIPQTLIREGDFAINLAEALKLGRASNEAEAESLLASVGIFPKNGWIADYPVTPDIIGELQDSIGVAADSGRLAMNKDDAIKAFQGLNLQQGLPVSVGTERQGTEAEPAQSYGEYSNPEVINNYYYEQGPPVVTYYPPPPDYGYLYSWVPYSFWCSGFWFPGFFVLNDFHRFHHVHGRRGIISNHVHDPKTRGVFSVDPRTRNTVRSPHRGTRASYPKGSTYPQTQPKASSILEPSRKVRPRNPVSSRIGSAQSSLNRNLSPSPSAFKGRAETIRPPTTGQWMSRGQTGISPPHFANPSARTTAPRFTMSPGPGSFGGFHGSSSLANGSFAGGGGRR
ncbi:MAG TPA: DUF4124 domain-containing protein [Thermodesulfobacteriota bacterium]|nr:DUF4124 domain-containing protein [Thermodesulfobacteriota bacterium]